MPLNMDSCGCEGSRDLSRCPGVATSKTSLSLLRFLLIQTLGLLQTSSYNHVIYCYRAWSTHNASQTMCPYAGEAEGM